jgi:hypothetical protein
VRFNAGQVMNQPAQSTQATEGVDYAAPGLSAQRDGLRPGVQQRLWQLSLDLTGARPTLTVQCRLRIDNRDGCASSKPRKIDFR